MGAESRAEKFCNEAIDREVAKDWNGAAEKWAAASLASKTRKKEYAKRQADCAAKASGPNILKGEYEIEMKVQPIGYIEPKQITVNVFNKAAANNSAKLLEEAMAEIERLTQANKDAAALLGEAMTEIEALQKSDGVPVAPDMPTREQWDQIKGFCGEVVDDAEAVCDILKIIDATGGEGDTLDECVSRSIAGAEEGRDEKLQTVLSDALHATLEAHDNPLREVWGRLSPFDQRRVTLKLDEEVGTALTESA